MFDVSVAGYDLVFFGLGFVLVFHGFCFFVIVCILFSDQRFVLVQLGHHYVAEESCNSD